MNRYRRSLGVERLRGTALLSWTAAVRTVVLVSRHYFGEEPDDWSDWKLEGFSAWTGPAGQATDPAVDDFVTSGPPPVLVCLGTSAAAGAASTFATIAHDLQAKDLRPLLLVGDPAHLQSLHDMPGAFAFAPVPSLAGRCAAAVVSGALGTLAAVLAAGIPVVVLPQLFDQVWHAKRVQDLGVGMMVRRPSQVAGAVAKVLADPGFQQRAAALGARLREEDGAAALVEAVELTL